MKRLGCLALMTALVFLSFGSALAQVVVVGNFGLDAELLNYVEGADDSYYELLLVDSGVGIASGREVFDEQWNGSIETVMTQQYSDAYDVSYIDTQPIAGYPAQRVQFCVGRNEDATRVEYLYIPADQWIFYVQISVPLDWLSDYEESVEYWIESVDLFDDGIAADPASESADEDDWGDVDEIFSHMSSEFLTWAEIEQYMNFSTDDTSKVDDLFYVFLPEWFVWYETEDGSSSVQISFICDGGSVDIIVDEAGGSFPPGMGGQGASDLPADVIEMDYQIASIQWDSPSFALYPVRGLYVGDQMEWVAETFNAGEIIDISGGESGYDEMVIYLIRSDDGADVVELTYYGSEGTIQCISLVRINND